MRLGFNEYRAEHGQYILQTQFKNYSEDSMGGGTPYLKLRQEWTAGRSYRLVVYSSRVTS